MTAIPAPTRTCKAGEPPLDHLLRAADAAMGPAIGIGLALRRAGMLLAHPLRPC